MPLISKQEETRQRTPVISLFHQNGLYRKMDKHPPGLSRATLARILDRHIRAGKLVVHQPSGCVCVLLIGC